MSEPTRETSANGTGAVTPPAEATASPVPELTPKEKRALREQARREFRAAERERMEAEARQAAEPSPVKSAAPAEEPGRTDAQRASDAAVFLRGVLMPFLAALLWPFGYTLKLAEFTEAKAREDASAWVPVARRYRWMDLTILWAGLPARLVTRVRELAERRQPKEAAK